MPRAGWAVAVTAASLALTGCGGSHSSSSHTTTSSATSSSSAGRLTEKVTVLGRAKPSARATAAPGDTVQIRTRVDGDPRAPAQLVTVSAGVGPATTLHITATSDGRRSRAQITSADGKPLTLINVHYTCALPGTSTFCPAKQSSSGAHGFKLAFMASPSTGVTFLASVGPGTAQPSAGAAGGLPTSAYIPTELVRTHASGATATTSGTTTTGATTGTATTFTTTIGTVTTTTSTVATATPSAGTSSVGTATSTPTPTSAPAPAAGGLAPAVTVTPGATVTMYTQLTGQSAGLPQKTTITIPKGPARKLTISAAVPEAHTSRATITRAGGGRLAIDPPRFRCAAPPAPTFCPPQSVVSNAHAYVVTFMATPHSSPILFEARVRGG